MNRVTDIRVTVIILVEVVPAHDDIHNNDANNWRSSNTVSSSSSSLFSRSESRSCETALHNSRTSEFTTGSIVFAPTWWHLLQNFFQTFYESKHGY
jgi:hypothetical protein